MRAIILAAGEGSRLRPLTNDRPKVMVEYKGKPILQYQMETMKACGIDDIIVVTGYHPEAVTQVFNRTVHNAMYESTNMVFSLFCAEEYFNDDIIVSYGDIIYEKSIIDQIIKSDHDFSVAVSTIWRELWEKRMADPLLDAETMKIDNDNNIIELGKKPKSYDEIQGQFMGLFKISKGIMNSIKLFYHSMDKDNFYDGKNFRNMFMTSFIQACIDKGFPVKAVLVDGLWLEIDTLADLAIDYNL